MCATQAGLSSCSAGLQKDECSIRSSNAQKKPVHCGRVAEVLHYLSPWVAPTATLSLIRITRRDAITLTRMYIHLYNSQATTKLYAVFKAMHSRTFNAKYVLSDSLFLDSFSFK